MSDFSNILAAGARLFNEGQYFEAHETWEECWRGEQGTRKELLQALIQVATALYHAGRGNEAGAKKLIERVRPRLNGLPDEYAGVDVEAFRSAFESWAKERGEAPVLTWTDADAVTAQCPYCGETVELTVEESARDAVDYVEDCSVCCRPWNVHVERGGEGVCVTLTRDDG